MTRIVVAETDRLSREGLLALFERETDIDVVGAAGDGHTCLHVVHAERPEVVLADVRLPAMNGIEVAHRLLREKSRTRVVVMAPAPGLASVRAAMAAGVAGYLLRCCGFAELVRAVRVARSGRTYLGPDAARVLVDDYRRHGHVTRPGAIAATLTPREREVIQLLAEGYPTKAIATRLFVSPKTVGTHREHIMAKLGLTSIAELTRYAIIEGISALDARCFGQQTDPADIAERTR